MSNRPWRAPRAWPALCTALMLAAGPLLAEDTPAGEALASANVQARTAAPPAEADAAPPDAAAEARPEGDKKLLGISILGNQEAPKALVLVPWKSSRLGDEEGLSRNLDDSRQPVDREVFMRELEYYEIREGSP